MIIDIHNHVGEFPQHFTEKYALSYAHLYVADPLASFAKDFPIKYEGFIKDMDEANVDKAVIWGYREIQTDTYVPDEYVYDFVKKNPERLIGFSAVQPIINGEYNAEGLKEFEKAIKDYGFKGLKLLPVYCHYYPNDKRVYPFYEKLVELDVPVLLHGAGSGGIYERNEFARPCYLEDVAMDFPELKIGVAHLGFPWTEELIALMRKSPNMYADISAIPRPTIFTWNLVAAKEYGVLKKLMFGSDYPFYGPRKDLIEFLKTKVNQIAERIGWPTLTKEEIDAILGENAMRFLGIK